MTLWDNRHRPPRRAAPIGALWNRVLLVAVVAKQRWKVWALAFACLLFTINTVHERAVVHAFESHVEGMADAGGGVLFVLSPADCLAATDITTSVVATLSGYGVAAQGLVVREGVTREGLALVLDAANQRFPHVAVGARGAVAFVGRAGTPMVLAVRADGVVTVMERLGVSGIGAAPAAPALTQRLLSGLGLDT